MLSHDVFSLSSTSNLIQDVAVSPPLPCPSLCRCTNPPRPPNPLDPATQVARPVTFPPHPSQRCKPATIKP
ncbi:hypothetical protein M0R45_016465 [Rubus argutus]|uniref:Uncharacterized protein n=1 Tax=Rubus argutus TaxID=59490 RepID=A0AAW1XV37_RUBAR